MLQIEEMLMKYKDALALLAINKAHLSRLESDCIEEICLGASIISDMPRSNTNEFKSKTENAIIYKESLIRLHKKMINEQNYRIAIVEGCLQKLTKDELLLISLKYFEGKTWGEIACNTNFDKDTVRIRVKHKILPKLQRLLE